MSDQDILLAESDSNLSPRRRAWAERNVGPAARALLDEDERYFLRQSVSTPCLTAIKKVEGIYIEDVGGRRYMDFHGNNVHHIGYSHPRLVAALKAQLDGLTFTPRRFTDEPAVSLARKLAEIAPGNLGKVLFSTGGSDALEMSLKLARAATGRHKFVSFWDSFHGAGFGAISVGGEDLFRSGPIGPLLPGTEHVAPPDCYHCAYGHRSPDSCGLACAKYLRYVLEKERDVAAVVAEPVRSLAVIPPEGYWREVRRACDELGTLLIFDEIPNGLGKSGRMFTCHHFDVVPDIIVLGKALGGGIVPIACMVARPELDVLQDRALGHYTHEKNPFTATAALTTLRIIEEEKLVENAALQGDFALNALREMALRHRLIGDVRGLGLLIGVELVRDRETRERAAGEADWVMYRALELGLSFKTAMGNVLTLTPPLVITRDQMESALSIIDQCLTEAEALF